MSVRTSAVLSAGVLAACALGLPAHGGGKPAEVDAQTRKRAEDAALKFARAFNEKSVDRQVGLAGFPFFCPSPVPIPSNFGVHNPLSETAKDLRLRLKNFPGTLPTEVQSVVSYAKKGERLLVGIEHRQALDEVMGKDGLIVYLRGPGKEGVCPVFVRVTGEQARVLGFLWTRPEKQPQAGR